jgi:uncharacterized protein YciI
MSAKREREQCWLMMNDWAQPRPAMTQTTEQMTDLHHQYIHDLDDKGVLVGAGPFLDETGARDGTGLIIIRAKTRAEAMAIATKEPWVASGQRILTLKPWQRTAGV